MSEEAKVVDDGKVEKKERDKKKIVPVTVQVYDENNKVSEKVIKIAHTVESTLTKGSVKFINGKRKINLRDHNKKQNKKRLLLALNEAKGNVSLACRAIGIDRTVHYRYKSEDPEYKAAYEHILEGAIDFVEDKLFENIEKGYEASTIFFLKTRAKHRGYSESVDVNVNPAKELEKLTDDDIEQRIKQISRALASSNGKEEEGG